MLTCVECRGGNKLAVILVNVLCPFNGTFGHIVKNNNNNKRANERESWNVFLFITLECLSLRRRLVTMNVTIQKSHVHWLKWRWLKMTSTAPTVVSIFIYHGVKVCLCTHKCCFIFKENKHILGRERKKIKTQIKVNILYFFLFLFTALKTF